MIQDVGERYDRTPYTRHCYPGAHPDRLCTMGLLFGLSPASTAGCRILEVGCAGGGHLVPMAAGLPGATLVGLDASGEAITSARSLADDLGLDNLELRHGLLEDLDDADGPFDYLIAHGVYSWVPAQVQEQLLTCCRALLAPHGIAYISANTLPGWHLRGAIRDAMRRHTRDIEDPLESAREARALLDLLASSVSDDERAWKAVLDQEQRWLRDATETYLFHDHLAPDNEAVDITEFLRRAGRNQLQFLADADPASMWLRQEALREHVARLAPERVGREQMGDWLRGRTFRQTLLCREELAVREEPVVQRVGMLLATTELVLETDHSTPERVAFRDARGNLGYADDPLVVALLGALASAHPADLPFGSLLRAVRELVEWEVPAGDLAQLLLTLWKRGEAELTCRDRRIASDPGQYPRTTELVLDQATRPDHVVTNLRHEVVQIDVFDRPILQLLDGTRDRRALCEQLTQHALGGTLPVVRDGRPLTDPAEVRRLWEVLVGERIPRYAGQALLTA